MSYMFFKLKIIRWGEASNLDRSWLILIDSFVFSFGGLKGVFNVHFEIITC